MVHNRETSGYGYLIFKYIFLCFIQKCFDGKYDSSEHYKFPLHVFVIADCVMDFSLFFLSPSWFDTCDDSFRSCTGPIVPIVTNNVDYRRTDPLVF